jgi:integrase
LELIGSDTKRNYLNALSAIFDYADVQPNPVREFRKSKLVRNARTKKAREQASSSIHPLTVPEGRRFLSELEAERPAAQLFGLLLFYTGMRLGEALALRWENVRPGRDADDVTRHVYVRGSLSRGRHDEGTKTAVDRRVAIPRPLRAALLDAHPKRTGVHVLELRSGDNFRAREFARVCERAGLTGHQLKDLRDNWAFQMLTAGVPLAYVANQLGHSMETCVQHYGRWCEEEYRDPMARQAGEVPADFLARLATPVALASDGADVSGYLSA